MCRTLLLPLVVGGLALGLPFVRGHLAERDGRAAAFVEGTEEHGVLAVSGSAVHFTLYRPKAEAGGERSILIFAADARARHPRPVQLFAQATAATGVASAYLEPSDAPAEAAARLKHVLQRQGSRLHVDSDAIWTWVEGQGLESPVDGPCKQNRLAAALSWLQRDILNPGVLVRRTLDWTLRAGCSAKHLL
jgi:hypothetical protein